MMDGWREAKEPPSDDRIVLLYGLGVEGKEELVSTGRYRRFTSLSGKDIERFEPHRAGNMVVTHWCELPAKPKIPKEIVAKVKADFKAMKEDLRRFR